MKSVYLTIDQINKLERDGLLFSTLCDASDVAQRENMAYRTNDYTVVHVVHKWTDEEYGYTVLRRLS